MWRRMSCDTLPQLPTKNTPRRPSLVFDQKYCSETYSEEIETSELSPLNNCALNGTTIDLNDGQGFPEMEPIEEDPVEALQAQLNSLSTENREKFALAMGGGDRQDFPSA